MPRIVYDFLGGFRNWGFRVADDDGSRIDFYNAFSWFGSVGHFNPVKATYTGSSGVNHIYLFATSQNVADGRGGNDVITVSYGGFNANNRVRGGSGDDIINCTQSRGQNQIWGDAGNDTLKGGSGVDIIEDISGNNTIFGNDGNDVITIGGFRGEAYGGNGADIIKATDLVPNLHVDGGNGNDRIEVDVLSGSIMGGSGNDTIEVTGRHNTINGNNGDDKIVVSGANNSIFGGNNDDNITAKGNSIKSMAVMVTTRSGLANPAMAWKSLAASDLTISACRQTPAQ